MKVRRIDTSRDPLFPGVMRGVWVDATNTLPTPPTPSPPTPELPFQLVPEMPAPPTDPKQEKKWQAALQIHDNVIAHLRQTPDFNSDLLYKVIKDLIEGNYSAGDVVAVYLHRTREGPIDG
jgi:hypothetical protein